MVFVLRDWVRRSQPKKSEVLVCAGRLSARAKERRRIRQMKGFRQNSDDKAR